MIDEWERAEKQKKLREQWEGTIAFVNMLFEQLDEKDKQIEELQKQIVQLKCDNNYLTAKCLEVECAKDSLREQIEKMKCCANCNTWLRNDDIKHCKNCPNLEGVKILRY
ncbi:MAG: hypothetical protein K6E97_03725 [Treponema sp.]|nr:hypothetical protein [Treponema sp.]